MAEEEVTAILGAPLERESSGNTTTLWYARERGDALSEPSIYVILDSGAVEAVIAERIGVGLSRHEGLWCADDQLYLLNAEGVSEWPDFETYFRQPNPPLQSSSSAGG